MSPPLVHKSLFASPNFQALFESLPHLYLIVTTDLTIVAVNDAYLHATMTRRENILGRYIFDVFPDNPEDQASKGTSNLRASFNRVLKNRTSDSMPVQKYDIRKPESEGSGFEVRYWSPINSPLMDEKGRITHIIHCVEDVTDIVLLSEKNKEHLEENERLRLQILERKEVEKTNERMRQAQKMESLGQLTGGIAHDFNNLLSVIMGNLDFLSEHIERNALLHGFINSSIEAAEHAAQLISQLLAFGRKQTLQPCILSTNETLTAFVNFARHTVGEHLSIISALAPDIWNINVDPVQLQNALMNLSVNARDAMPEGGKIIYETKNIILDEDYISANNADIVPGEYVMISVSDTGSGMAPEIMEKAFEPFFTTKEVGKGTGLGLSMVYGFIKQSKGHIKVYSELHHGTSVKIYLPREKHPLAVAETNALPLDRENMPGNKARTILIVEDNKAVLKSTRTMIESLGYKYIAAENGNEALDILEKHSGIDLLMTDIMLPGSLNGSALAKKAVELYPHIKVLFNSGYAEQTIVENGLLEKDAHLLSKPFRKQQLADKLSELLD